MRNRFDSIIERRNTCSLKWDYCQERFGKKDILPMWVADMDFPSPKEITEAMKRRAEHRMFGYMGIKQELNHAIINWLEKRNHWTVEMDWLVHTPGVVTSINIAILAFTDVGDKVLVQTPVYYPFYSSIKDNDRHLVENPLIDNDGYYTMDFDDLEKKFADGVKMMVFCSPHNPVGRVWTDEELDQVAKLCNKYNVLLVSDEIHADLVYKDYKHIPMATVSRDILQASITCISPTKTFNIAGLAHSAVIIPNPELRQKFQKTLNRTGAGMLNIFGMEAAEAAYSYGEKWLDELMDYLTGNLEMLDQYVREEIPSIKFVKPEATYLAWLDCRGFADKVGNLKEFFVHKAGVGMNDGVTFGKDGAGFQRINFACPREVLLEGLGKIKDAIDKHVK